MSIVKHMPSLCSAADASFVFQDASKIAQQLMDILKLMFAQHILLPSNQGTDLQCYNRSLIEAPPPPPPFLARLLGREPNAARSEPRSEA